MDGKLLVSIYAAVISTVVFVWRLYEFYDDKKGKIKVRLHVITQIPFDMNNKLGTSERFLVATITNLSKYKRLIERPGLKSNIQIDGKSNFSFINFEDRTKYPFALEPGEKFEYKMLLDGIDKNFKKKGTTKLKSVVSDTHNKVYYSKWFKL